MTGCPTNLARVDALVVGATFMVAQKTSFGHGLRGCSEPPVFVGNP